MAANPLSAYGPAPVDSNGVLSCWVQQPVDNSPVEQSNQGIKYQEKFKGPYSVGKGILSSIKTGDSLTDVHTALGSIVSRYATPSCPVRNNCSGYWQVQKIQVKELGAHCELTIDCIAQYDTIDPTQDQKEDPWRDVWSVSWQSYTVSPYAFCANLDHADAKVVPGQEYEPDWQQTASRSHIEQFKNSINGTFTTLSGACIYSPNSSSNDRRYLNEAEIAIMKKASLNKSAVYHYPILRHQTVLTGEYSPEQLSGTTRQGYTIRYPQTLGVGLDVGTYMEDEPRLANCPYPFEDSIVWIKIGDDMVQTKSKDKATNEFQRVETWMGTLDPDVNFYGPHNGSGFTHDKDTILFGRWEVGML